MTLKVIGGGLAGCEAAWQAAERGIDVELYEMRPEKSTGAHRTGDLGELVCSNSLGSNLLGRAAGLLKAELRLLGSMLISCADASSVPAGGALWRWTGSVFPIVFKTRLKIIPESAWSDRRSLIFPRARRFWLPDR